jgi:hypothetical protein
VIANDRVDPGPFPPLEVTEVKALACQLPATSGVPLSRWSCAEMAAELVARGLVESISPATVWRILAADAICPWRHRMWIFPRDPNFAAKAVRALDLYARVFEGQALGDNEFVICADEKTSIQARCRCHPTLPPGRARMMRVEHEYERRGALACLAAYDVHRAKAFGRTEDTTGIEGGVRQARRLSAGRSHTRCPLASATRWLTRPGLPCCVLGKDLSRPSKVVTHEARSPLRRSALDGAEDLPVGGYDLRRRPTVIEARVVDPQDV